MTEFESAHRLLESGLTGPLAEVKPYPVRISTAMDQALMLETIRALLVHIDDEIEQRKHSGNAEDWAELEKQSNAGHDVISLIENGFTINRDGS